MNPAAPLLLRDRPAGLPIRKSIIAIVRICWPRWQRRGHDDGPWRRHDDGLRWGRGRWAATMVNAAAPLFLVRCPRALCVDSAIEWVYWPRGCGRSCWRRRRWWCREWRRWHCDNGRWQSCSQTCSRTTAAHRRTAVIFLRLGPRVLNHRRAPEAGLAIERQR